MLSYIVNLLMYLYHINNLFTISIINQFNIKYYILLVIIRKSQFILGIYFILFYFYFIYIIWIIMG
jgi:hypothetical protein